MVKTNKVKARIVELGYSYVRLAQDMDMDYSTLNSKLSNKRRIYLDEVANLCKLLKINTAEQLKDYFNLDFLILS